MGPGACTVAGLSFERASGLGLGWALDLTSHPSSWFERASEAWGWGGLVCGCGRRCGLAALAAACTLMGAPQACILEPLRRAAATPSFGLHILVLAHAMCGTWELPSVCGWPARQCRYPVPFFQCCGCRIPGPHSYSPEALSPTPARWCRCPAMPTSYWQPWRRARRSGCGWMSRHPRWRQTSGRCARALAPSAWLHRCQVRRGWVHRWAD
jgi:hypothetical protein